MFKHALSSLALRWSAPPIPPGGAASPGGIGLARLFDYPFRIFFASATLLAVVALPLWLAMLLGGWQPGTAMAPLDWHRHEMVFGFLEAATAGFLLTAVCVWTNTERTHGARLFALWSVWAAGRVLMLLGGALPAWLVAAVDLAFLPLVMLDAGARIWRTGQRRQLVLMLVVGTLWLMELQFHLDPGGPWIHGALIVAMLLMLVIGGRIAPAFTANWLRMRGADPAQVRCFDWLERTTIGSVFALLALVLVDASGVLPATIAVAAALLSALRLALWSGWATRREPLLWILHVGLAWIPIALALLAASLIGWCPPSAWAHAAGAGAAGTLILGVMSRVVLGHTGRALELPRGMRWAFVAVILAGALRVATTLGWLPPALGWRDGLVASAALWLLAYGLFAWRYWRILASPRIDGRPG